MTADAAAAAAAAASSGDDCHDCGNHCDHCFHDDDHDDDDGEHLTAHDLALLSTFQVLPGCVNRLFRFHGDYALTQALEVLLVA